MKRAFSFLAIIALLVGCRTPPAPTGAPVVARFALEAEAPQAVEVVLPVSGVKLHVLPKPVFSEFDLVGVDLAQVELGRCLLFRLSGAAARDLYRLTAANQGRRLVLLLDGVPVGARVIDGPLADGAIAIFIERPEAELPALVQRLQRTTANLRRMAAR